MNTDGTGFHTCNEFHETESLSNHTATDRKEEEQLEDRRSVGASSCNCGDGTDRRVQSLMFMVMILNFLLSNYTTNAVCHQVTEASLILLAVRRFSNAACHCGIGNTICWANVPFIEVTSLFPPLNICTIIKTMKRGKRKKPTRCNS
jgi:hypothetical protein